MLLVLVIVCFLLIALSLSYFLLWLIYRKVFESQEQISIALTFVVSIGLVMLFVYPPMVFFYFLFFCLSYIIWWLIYRKLFKSQKHISKFLVVLGSIGLIMFYYTPYSYYLEPSFYEFKEMCKLNELPNNEEKYNKILRYFDTDLESLDWEELNKKTWKISEDSGDYKKGVFEYASTSKSKKINYRLGIAAGFYSNEPKINRYNINAMRMYSNWNTRRYTLEKKSMASYELEWNEEKMICADVVKDNMTPKGASNEQQTTD